MERGTNSFWGTKYNRDGDCDESREVGSYLGNGEQSKGSNASDHFELFWISNGG